MAIVAAAGPLMNFLLALVCWAVVRHVDLSSQGMEVLTKAYIVNLVLGIFNLIPVPPLDGSRIIGVVMDDATYVRWIRLDQYGMVAVFGAFFLFQDQFTRVLNDLIIHMTRVMDVLVLAT
jgi:Zn-dependent protease